MMSTNFTPVTWAFAAARMSAPLPAQAQPICTVSAESSASSSSVAVKALSTSPPTVRVHSSSGLEARSVPACVPHRYLSAPWKSCLIWALGVTVDWLNPNVPSTVLSCTWLDTVAVCTSWVAVAASGACGTASVAANTMRGAAPAARRAAVPVSAMPATVVFEVFMVTSPPWRSALRCPRHRRRHPHRHPHRLPRRQPRGSLPGTARWQGRCRTR